MNSIFALDAVKVILSFFSNVARETNVSKAVMERHMVKKKAERSSLIMQQGKVKQRLREPTKQLVTKEEEIKITNQAISHLEEAMC